MVFELHFRPRRRIQALRVSLLAAFAVLASPHALAATKLQEAAALYKSGQYFKAARYAFAASEEDPRNKDEAYSWITVSLMRAGLHNSASYFFIRTLQTGDKKVIRRVLPFSEELLMNVGGDILRNYLIRHTAYGDYDKVNRSAYLYSLSKEALLGGQEEKALGYVNGMSKESPLYPFALQIRASANAILGRNSAALKDFEECAKESSQYAVGSTKDPLLQERQEKEAEDLKARCTAGKARVLYQMNGFADADKTYDKIPKKSFVWTDILFEQAWNAFARQEYNRTLGKLVTYKSPALSFVFNSEVDVLRAQAFLALCQYSDANDSINEFNSKYARLGQKVKKFVERNSDNLYVFYREGKKALDAPLHTKDIFHQMLNRFVRGPYFQNLVVAESAVDAEISVVKQFASMHRDIPTAEGRGFPGFLEQVLSWRRKAVQLLGGAYVKNSLMDYHSVLISDFEKMAFIKLEMLGRAKEKLLYRKHRASSRMRGNVLPSRRDDQYRWSFNGEFWNDEIGDYVFGLESECT